MRHLLLAALTLLAACRSDFGEVKPEKATITELVFKHSGTIAGIDHILTLSDEQQIFKSRQCERAIDFDDWRKILDSFDYQAFEALPARPDNECCDQSIYVITLRTAQREYRYELSTFTATNVVRPFIDSLSRRTWNEALQCK
jgi:hypothetical protein